MTATAFKVRSQDQVLRDLERTWAPKRGLPGFFGAVNHKQIGLRFIWTAVAFLVIGGIEALLIRIQLAGSEQSFLSPEAYNQLFTMHGTTMMFLFAVPILEGLALYLVPLQIGARDLPFPRLNAFGYWVYLAGGILLNWSFVSGSVPDGGWFAYVPLTGPEFTPDRSMDFWLLGVTFVEIAGIIGAIELVVVILRFRAPGMTLSRIPIFSWSILVMGAMMLIAFPFVIAASSMLELERKFGAPFYDPSGGGNPLLWQHLFWIFGHPEVYIMLIPAVGAASAVIVAHTRRPIVGYGLVVAALIAIAVTSFGLWVHHMFTVGLPLMVLSIFAIESYFIAVPSGITVFSWLGTIWEGRPRWRTPMWFVVGTLITFVAGGVTGVMVATAPFDAQAHDSFFVVAHFHYVLIGGVVFPVFAGLHHWFPKFTGRLASEVGGKIAFWLMFIGFHVTFFPQHWLGLQGMARRVYTYDSVLGWDSTNLVSTIGAFVLAAGFAVFIGNLLHAWRWGQVSGDDPWGADSLEWSTTSPPKIYDFDRIPVVTSRNPLWDDRPHDLHPDVAQGLLTLARPWRNRREVVQTSIVDAAPEAIVTQAGVSYRPVATTLLLSITIVGILVDWWLLAGVAALATLGSVVAWGISNSRLDTERLEPRLPGSEDDVLAEARIEAEAAFARHTPVGRSARWWASAIALGSIGVIVGAFIYGYFYLRLGDLAWPPPETVDRSLALPGIALALVLLATAVAPTIKAGLARAAAAVVIAGVALGIQGWALFDSGWAIDANAFEAISITVEVLAMVLLASAWLARAVAVVVATRNPAAKTRLDWDGPWWIGSVLIWLAAWAVVHLIPGVG